MQTATIKVVQPDGSIIYRERITPTSGCITFTLAESGWLYIEPHKVGIYPPWKIECQLDKETAE